MYDDKVDKDTVKAYRKVFSTPDGKKVLAHMLTELGFFDEVPVDDVMAVSLQNYAKHLLARCGIIRGEVIYDVVSMLFKIPYEEER